MKNLIISAIAVLICNIIVYTQTCEPVTSISEGFNSSVFPACWSKVIVKNNGGYAPTLTSVTSSSPAPVANPYEGTHMLLFNSNTCENGDQIRLISPVINTISKTGINVSFAWYESTYGRTDSVILQYSTDNINWNKVSTYYRTNQTDPGWKIKSVNLPAGAENQDTLYVGFLFVSNESWNCLMDDIKIISGLSTVSTMDISSVTDSLAVIRGYVDADGGNEVTARGICLGTSPGPSLSGFHTVNGSGTGLFLVVIDSLKPGYKYYARAYATNAIGTSYGNELSFNTLCQDSIIMISEGFNSSSLPSCWITKVIKQTGVYVPSVMAITTSNYPVANPFEGSHMLKFNSINTQDGSQVRLESPAFITTGKTGINVSFRWYGSTSGGIDNVTIQYSLDKVNWSDVNVIMRRNSYNGWRLISVNLPAEVELKSEVYLGLLFTSNGGFDCLVDDIRVISGTPTFSTSEMSFISESSATVNSKIISDGGSPVLSRGICYDVSPRVSIEQNYIVNGSDTGLFVTNLDSLETNKTYCLRAYATNAVGTAYGNEITFKTPCSGIKYIHETFNDIEIPECWHQTIVNDPNKVSPSLISVTECTLPSATPFEGVRMLKFASSEYIAGTVVRLESPILITTGKTNINLQFEWFESNLAGNDSVTIQYSTDKVNWENVTSFKRNNSIQGWKTKSVMLPKTAENQSAVYAGILFTSDDGYDCLMDNIKFRSLIPDLTIHIAEITETSVAIDGTIFNYSDSVVLTRGFCWSTSPDVNINGQCKTEGSGDGWFTGTLTPLLDKTTYYARIFVTISDSTYYSEEISFKTGLTGLTDITEQGLITVYPNPTSGTVSVVFNEKSDNPLEIEVFSMLGEQVLRKIITSGESIDLSGNPDGIYFLRVQSERIITRKIMLSGQSN